MDEFTLNEVAERASITVQTILRRFGSRQGLIAATLIHVEFNRGGTVAAPKETQRRRRRPRRALRPFRAIASCAC